MLISKSPEFERCSKKTDGDIMSDWTPQQEKFLQKKWNGLLDMDFQDALKWLYSEGWYFQTEYEAWRSNSALFQDITTNGRFGSYMDILEPREFNYIDFKSLNMKEPVLMRYGTPNEESDDWPNDVIKNLIGIGGYDAINKRKI
jgi:hypothetical protein